MKKLFAIILAVLLLAGMGVTVFADGGSDNTTEITEATTQPLTIFGTYRSYLSTDTISVAISWSGLSFTYHPRTQGTWNDVDHVWSDGQSAGWDASNGKITIVNNSNVEIEVSYSATSLIGNNFALTFTDNQDNISGARSGSIYLLSADSSEYQNAPGPSAVINVKPTGRISSDADNTAIATINLTIAAAA